MRIDVVTIFPDYLAPLDLSLIGKARRDGLLHVRVRDLRDFTHDRHRSVDDTPYGGGAGMVMSPQPWGEALDALLADHDYGLDHEQDHDQDLDHDHDQTGPGRAERPLLIVPGPAGEPFTHAVATELATYPWLVFACGRYEGIDERVREHARDRLGASAVREISLGDYVVNGGEVAVLAMIEAIARLLPGVIGNEESLREESHAGGLLEYPVYTKPPSWRGYDVPSVLLSGDHAAIARWRREESLRRTASRRPDLLPAHAAQWGGTGFTLSRAVAADAGELWTLTLACAMAEVRRLRDTDWPWAVSSEDEVRETLLPGSAARTWVLRAEDTGRMVGAVRGELRTGALGEDASPAWEVACLMVAPDLQERGLGHLLLDHALARAPEQARRAVLVVSRNNARLRRLYRRAGFTVRGASDAYPGTLELERPLEAARVTSG